MTRSSVCSFLFFTLFLHTCPIHAVLAQTEVPRTVIQTARQSLGGRLEASVGGHTLLMPHLKTDIKARIQGDLAAITVEQTFMNPGTTPMNVSYLFPLNKEAAVCGMVLEVGDEVIRAQIAKKKEARQKYEKAKRKGKGASLLNQHRPNMFSMEVANLMPGLPIRTRLEYVHPLPKVDGAYELVIPLVVGPRYQPSILRTPKAGYEPHEYDHGSVEYPEEVAGGREDGEDMSWDLDELPDYPRVAGIHLPDLIDPARVSLQIVVDGGLPVRTLQSPSHSLKINHSSDNHKVVTLSEGRTIDNRDFIFRYELAGSSPQAGLMVHRDQRGGFFHLLLEPPKVPKDEDITPREMVFVLDCSGSMEGLPLKASKLFMQQALVKLRPKDYFRIIQFSSAATSFSETPMPANMENISAGMDYIESLRGGGGTEMHLGVLQALKPPVPENCLRLVVFLTDGYIGRESFLLNMIQKEIGEARLFAFGVGASVNRYLLSEMARVGKGFVRYMDPSESPEEVALEMARKLDTPVLTDIRIDWGTLDAVDVTPSRVPDLFAHDSLSVQGRFNRSGPHVITVHGKINGRAARLPIRVNIPGGQSQGNGDALPITWARAKIAEHLRDLVVSGRADAKKDIIRLGMKYSLVTNWTSFVAVTQKVYNNKPGKAVDRAVPLQKIRGVSNLAYGNDVGIDSTGDGKASMSGGTTPEPGAAAGMIVLALLVGSGIIMEKLWKKRTLVSRRG